MKNWQKVKYPREKLKNHDGNYGCGGGEISGGLVVFDWDFREGFNRKKEGVKKIYKELQEVLPRLSETGIVETPHGYHFYYIMEDNKDIGNTSQENGRYKKGKFIGINSIRFSKYLKGLDTRANGGYVVYPPSSINGKNYCWISNKPILKITKDEYQQILDFFKFGGNKIANNTMRKGFVDILNGKIDIEEMAQKTKQDEHVYWKETFHEAYNVCGLRPEELLEGLAKFQASYDVDKTKEQLNNKEVMDYILSDSRLIKKNYSIYFPNHVKQTSKTSNMFGEDKKKKPKRKALSADERKAAQEFIELSEKKRWEMIKEILDFSISGEIENKQLLFMLKFGNNHRDLTSFISFRGDPSAGKSYICDHIIDMFPTWSTYIFDYATSAVLKRDEKLNNEVDTMYLREMTENNTLIEILKPFFDSNPIFKFAEPNEKGKWVAKEIQKRRIGIITTLSFENLPIDFIDRSWVLTPDQSYVQNKEVVHYSLNKEISFIEYHLKEAEIRGKIELIRNATRLYDYSYKPKVIFGDLIKSMFPKEHLNVRRDVNKMLNLIKTIAIFNQNQRKFIEIGDHKYLLADYYDLRLALEISESIFTDVILHLDEVKRGIIDYLEANLLSQESYTTTNIYDGVKKDIAVSRKTVGRKLKDLVAEGYLSSAKIKNSWRYKKIKGYNLIKLLNIESLKDKIKERIKHILKHQNTLYEKFLEADRVEELIEEIGLDKQFGVDLDKK